MASLTFADLIDACDDYIDQEGLDCYDLLCQITEHYVPGIENEEFAVMPLEFDRVN